MAACTRLFGLGLSLLLSACAGAAIPPKGASGPQYGAIVDAGSTGSRVAIYGWYAGGDQRPQVWPVASAKGDCPIAAFANAQDGTTCPCLKKTAADAIAQAQDFLGSRLHTVPVWVKATAGVREAERRHPGSQAKILAATRSCLGAADGYRFEDAAVISGAEEGAYAWIAVNHLAGTLGASRIDQTTGIVELGGQSAQIAFRVAAPPGWLASRPDEGVITIPLGPDQLHIYAISHLGAGETAAMAAIREHNPAACADDRAGDECRQDLDWFLCRSGAVTRAGCPNLSRRLDPDPRMAFVGLSAFAYAVRNMGLGHGATLKDVRERADAICGPSSPVSPRAVLRGFIFKPAGSYPDVCFDAFYSTHLVEQGWAFDLARVHYPDLQRGTDPGWSIGAMIVEAAKQSR